jgi:hypothetical protein
MTAKAGIQQGLEKAMDSRLRGNDNTAGCHLSESAAL